jgi:nitroreductase
MDFQELIRVRRSVRGYKPDPIDEDILWRILQAGRIAPTACNLQPFHLIVVTDAETRGRMKAVYAREWFYCAPVILVGCAEPAKAWQRKDGFNAAEVDLTIAMDHIILAATEEGLGTCWVCAFNEAKAKEVLGVPPEVRVLAMTPLGYPDPAAELRPFVRKPIEDLVRREHW